MTDRKIVPVTYVNSTAAVKAMTGRVGGACCTSSNVRNVFEWALADNGAGGEKVFAVPDQHLGAEHSRCDGLLPRGHRCVRSGHARRRPDQARR